MRTYKGEIEHSNQKVEESKLKRFAFNSMKRAKEGLMIVTFSVALVTGFTNNVYGDEKMNDDENPKGTQIYAPQPPKHEQTDKDVKIAIPQKFLRQQSLDTILEQIKANDITKSNNISLDKYKEFLNGRTLSQAIEDNKENLKKLGLSDDFIEKIVEIAKNNDLTKENNLDINKDSENVQRWFLIYFSLLENRNDVINTSRIHLDGRYVPEESINSKLLGYADRLYTEKLSYEKQVRQGGSPFQIIPRGVNFYAPSSLINPNVILGYNGEIQSYLDKKEHGYTLEKNSEGNAIGMTTKFSSYAGWIKEQYTSMEKEIRKNPKEFLNMNEEQVRGFFIKHDDIYDEEKHDQLKKYAEGLLDLERKTHNLGMSQNITFSWAATRNWTLAAGVGASMEYSFIKTGKGKSEYGSISLDSIYVSGLYNITEDWNLGLTLFASEVTTKDEQKLGFSLQTENNLFKEGDLKVTFGGAATVYGNVGDTSVKEVKGVLDLNLNVEYDDFFAGVGGKGGVGRSPYGLEWTAGGSAILGYGPVSFYGEYRRTQNETIKTDEVEAGVEVQWDITGSKSNWRFTTGFFYTYSRQGIIK